MDYKSVTKSICFLIIVLYGVSFVTACSASGSETQFTTPDGVVRISGILPKTEILSSVHSPERENSLKSNIGATVFNRSLSSVVTHVAAIPVVTEEVDAEKIQETVDNAETLEVEDDGSFEANVSSDSNYLLLLINRDAESRENIVKGYISVQDGNETLVQFPTEFALDDFALGNLTDDTEKSESVSESELAVSLDKETLGVWARVDDVLKMIQNYYTNYNQVTGEYYRLETTFEWEPDSYPINSRLSPEDLDYSGFKLDIYTNAISDQKFRTYRDEERTIALFPPEGFINEDELVYEDGEPISNKRHPNSSYDPKRTDHYFQDEDLAMDDSTIWDGEFCFSCYRTFDVDSVIPGTWYLAEGDSSDRDQMNELAAFDLGAASPFDEAGNPRVFLPAVTVKVEEGYRITDVIVDFFQYNEVTGTYEPVADEVMNEQVSSLHVGLGDWNGDSSSSERIDEHFNPITETYSDLEGEWYIGDYPGEYDREAEIIGISYKVSTTNYYIELHR